LAQLPHTIVIYESPHRIVDSLNDIASVFGDSRPMTLARELTKRFETLLHGPVRDVISTVLADANQQRGEFVLVLAGTAMQDESSHDVMSAADLDKTLSVLLKHLPVKTVARCAAELCGVTRKTAYDRALQQQRR
jgi:16S rRNA (cytidine1402-2'-O)-methyltransferase